MHGIPRIRPTDPSHLVRLKTRVMTSMMTSPSTAVSGVNCAAPSDMEIAEEPPANVIHGFGPLWRNLTIGKNNSGDKACFVFLSFKEARLLIPDPEKVGEMIAHLSGLARRRWLQTLETRHRRTFRSWAYKEKDDRKLSKNQWRPTQADYGRLKTTKYQWIRPGFTAMDFKTWSKEFLDQMQAYTESIDDDLLPSNESDRSWWLAANYEVINDWWRQFASTRKYPLMCFSPNVSTPRFRELTKYYDWSARCFYKHPIEHYICRALRSRELVRRNFPFTIRSGSLRALHEFEKAEKEHRSLEQNPDDLSKLDSEGMWVRISELPGTADVAPVVVTYPASDFCRGLGDYLSRTSCVGTQVDPQTNNSEPASESLGYLEGVLAMKFDTGFNDGLASDHHSAH